MPKNVPPQCQKLQDEVDETHRLLDAQAIPPAPDLPTRVQLLIDKTPGNDLETVLGQLRRLLNEFDAPDQPDSDQP